MPATRNLRLFTPYLVCSLEGVCHGIYLLWLTVHKGISPFAACVAIAVGDLALLLLEVPTGVFADRLGPRRSLLLGSACQVLGLALFWRASSLVALAVAVLAIAAGDAFRHGADEALLYRSCAATGQAGAFGRVFARAQAWALAAMVGLTALGGWIAERAGFDAAWALEVALALVGLALAWSMTELPSTPEEPPDPDDEQAGSLVSLRGRLPWSLLVPAAIVVALGSAGELVIQTAPRAGFGAKLVALVIAAALVLEAVGAWLVARGLVPLRARVLDAIALVAAAALAGIALAPGVLWPGLLLVFLGSGMAPAIRSALLQAGARDGERATVASAAGAVDMLGKTAVLPLAAWLYGRWQLTGTAAVLGAAAVVVWALARRSSARGARANRRG